MGLTKYRTFATLQILESPATPQGLCRLYNHMNTQQNYQDRIVVNPQILVGKPVVKGTRIPVELVLERLEEDTDTTLLFEDYPQLTDEDIKACLWYAKELVKGEE